MSGQEHPHASLVAYGFQPDYKRIYFATSRDTKKYGFLSKYKKVAALIDNRSSGKGFFGLDATIMTGTAKEIPKAKPSLYQEGRSLIIKRHPYLEEFLDGKGTAMFLVDGIEFTLVPGLKSSFRWKP